MSTINYTYNVIVDRFRQFAAGHFQLRRFTHGEISQADLEKEAEWPWMHVKPRAINYSPGTRAFSFEIFISDLPRDKEDKTGYQAESITDCSLIFQDLINEIHLGQMFGDDVLLTRPVNSEPFVEQYTHTLTGVTGIIELSMDYDWSACSIPASWNYNTPTNSNSSGFGSLQFIESLEQNGVFVSLDNDVEAPGNSYYYGTNGAGVKGWYASQAGTVTSVGLTAGTGISVSGGPITSSGSITVTNSAPDQVVALTAGTGITTSGTYPNFTITNSAPSSGGTVTSVTATLPISSTGGATPNLSMSSANGTTNGYLLASDWLIFNAKFNTPSGTTLQYLRGDGSLATFPTITSGTVTSVAALTLGTTGTDLSSTVATSTTTPVITLNVPTASAANRGALSSADWTTFNSKLSGLTVGTTAIASGTVGRVLFEGTGNVLQESANLLWNNTSSLFRINGGIGVNRDAFGGRAIDVTGGGIRLGGSTNGTFEVNGGNATTTISTVGGLDGLTLTDTSNAIFKFTANAYTYRFLLGGGTQRLEIRDQNQADATRFAIATTGNVLIGTTTDAGFKLDVNGTAMLRGIVYGVGSGGGAIQLLTTAGTGTAVIGGNALTPLRIQGQNLQLLVGSTQIGQFFVTTGNLTLQNAGTFTDVASSRLTINSTTQGFLPPRMTSVQKNAIATPASGLVVYDTTLNKLCVYGASAWETITSV